MALTVIGSSLTAGEYEGLKDERGNSAFKHASIVTKQAQATLKYIDGLVCSQYDSDIAGKDKSTHGSDEDAVQYAINRTSSTTNPPPAPCSNCSKPKPRRSLLPCQITPTQA